MKDDKVIKLKLTKGMLSQSKKSIETGRII